MTTLWLDTVSEVKQYYHDPITTTIFTKNSYQRGVYCRSAPLEPRWRTISIQSSLIPSKKYSSLDVRQAGLRLMISYQHHAGYIHSYRRHCDYKNIYSLRNF